MALFNIALNFPDFFYRWQTLLTGLLALGGAAWTVRAIQSQIKQASDAENDRRQRNERAARAILPLALYDISDYARECMLLMSPFISGSARQNPIIVPPIPPALIEPLQAAIRSANPQTAGEIAGVIAWLQIQHARLRSLADRVSDPTRQPITPVLAAEALLDAAELSARCASLFPYARDDRAPAEVSFQSRLGEALFGVQIVPEDNPVLQPLFNRRQNPSPISTRLPQPTSTDAAPAPPRTNPATP